MNSIKGIGVYALDMAQSAYVFNAVQLQGSYATEVHYACILILSTTW